mmetsp:Transcript_28275/g.34938  ORF Transcript_28275/g.34938 Transcript_28275/m.34938 type:complete len:131 (-) Transcript_28275:275-667(-)
MSVLFMNTKRIISSSLKLNTSIAKYPSSLLSSSKKTSTSTSTLSTASSWLSSSPLSFIHYRCMGTKALFKTNKSAAKRFRVRGSGSIKRNKGGSSHNTGYKARSRSNRLGQSCGIKEPKIEKRMRRLIGK